MISTIIVNVIITDAWRVEVGGGDAGSSFIHLDKDGIAVGLYTGHKLNS